MLFKRGEGWQESALVNLKHNNRNVKIQKKSWNMEIFQKNKKVEMGEEMINYPRTKAVQ